MHPGRLRISQFTVAASEVVRRILLAADQLLRVEELAVGPGADLINHSRLEVDEHLIAALKEFRLLSVRTRSTVLWL